MSSVNVIVANDLRTGRVVYLDRRGNWQQSIGNAQMFADSERLETALAQAQSDEQNNHVIAPEVVVFDEQQNRPQHYREQIRSHGPGCLPQHPPLLRSA